MNDERQDAAPHGDQNGDKGEGVGIPGDAARREAIEAAAYEVLAERGYRRSSMLMVAKRARASNGTLYRWYGSKEGLFAAMIARNADEAARLLESARGDDLDARMHAFGAALLEVLTGERAIALNRAAAADASETRELGRALARSGRDRILPLLRTVFEHAQAAGALGIPDLDDALETYVALLVGDLQVRRVSGALPPLEKSSLRARAEGAWTAIRTGRLDGAKL